MRYFMNVNSFTEVQANAMEEHEQTEAVLKARQFEKDFRLWKWIISF